MSLLLDALLLLILILAIPIGVYRGGIREGFTAAGILLGAQLAAEWAVPWGDFIGDHSSLATDASRFLVALLLLLLATAIIGYGSGIAFTYHPGPGGRFFGGILGLLNGILFVGFVIDFVIVFLFRGSQPELVRHGYLSRGLSVGTGTILLIGCGVVIGAMLFGMLVREREDDQMRAFQAQAAATRPSQVDRSRQESPTLVVATGGADAASSARTGESTPVQIREIRHWETPDAEPEPPRLPESQWSQTWPRSSMGPSVQPPWTPAPPATTGAARSASGRAVARGDDETLRDWLERTGAAGDRPPRGGNRDDPRDVRDDLDE